MPGSRVALFPTELQTARWREGKQRNLGILFPGVEIPGGESLTLSVQSKDVDVFAFAALIDNASRDLNLRPGRN